MFDECKTVGEMKFNFVERGSVINYCVSLARKMPRFEKDEDMEHLLRHAYIADEFTKERSMEFAACLADPTNTLCFLTSKCFDDKSLPLKEHWYKIDYSADAYPAKMLEGM